MTPEQKAALEAANARIAGREPFFMGGVRTAAQGLSFGYGDELEAAAMSALKGIPYEQAVGEARRSMETYKEQNPLTSIGLEMAGALPYAVTGIGAGLGLGGMAALGAASGAVTATGQNEGSLMDRAANPNVAVGAALGAAAAPIAKAVTGAIGGLANKAMDFARRTFGQRGSAVFDNYIQDLVQRTGKTADELVAEIGDGRMLIDNKTVASIARGALVQNAEGGASGSIIRREMEGRPESLRSAVNERLLRDLTGRTTGESPAQIQRQLTAQAEDWKTRAYAPFKNEMLDPSVEQQLLREMRGSPSIMNEVEDAYRVQTRGRSLFVRDEDGNVIGFDRALTADDAERIRRAAANMATREYEASRGLVGEAAAGLEQDLRSTVDTLYPQLQQVREQTSGLFRAGLANKPPADNAFALGQKSLMNADQAALDWNSVVGDPMLEEAFRRGLMDSLSRRLSSQSANTTLARISGEASDDAFSQVFRMAYPDANLDDAIEAMKLAVDAQATRNTVLGGSPTSANISEAARANAGIDPIDAFEAATGSIPAMMRFVNSIVGKSNPALSVAEKERLAQLLIETNPDIVRRALTDDGALRTLQNALQIYSERVSAAAGVGAANSASLMVPNQPLRLTIDQPANQ